MRRTRPIALCLLTALLACAPEKPPAPDRPATAAGGAKADGSPPTDAAEAPVLAAEAKDCVLTYAGERGEFADTNKPADVPEEARGLVRVTLLSGPEPPAGRVWVANLRAPGADGGWQLSTVERGLFGRADAEAIRAYAARALAAAGPVAPVLVHGDLQARHVLVDGDRVVLVDLGDAGWGDPALDLVVLTHLDLERRAEVLAGYAAGPALRARVAALGPTYSLWRNLFVSRWYHANAFEQRRNTEVARHVLATEVLAGRRAESPAPRTELACRVALVDFDGLLVDTEHAGWRSWSELFAAHGRALPIADWAARCGSDDPLSPWDELEAVAADFDNLDALAERLTSAPVVLTARRWFASRSPSTACRSCRTAPCSGGASIRLRRAISSSMPFASALGRRRMSTMSVGLNAQMNA